MISSHLAQVEKTGVVIKVFAISKHLRDTTRNPESGRLPELFSERTRERTHRASTVSTVNKVVIWT